MNERFVIQDLGDRNADVESDNARLRSIIRSLRIECERAEGWRHKQGRDIGGSWACVPVDVIRDILEFEDE